MLDRPASARTGLSPRTWTPRQLSGIFPPRPILRFPSHRLNQARPYWCACRATRRSDHDPFAFNRFDSYPCGSGTFNPRKGIGVEVSQFGVFVWDLATQVSLERDGKCHVRTPRLARCNLCDLTDGDVGVALKECLEEFARIIGGSLASKLGLSPIAAIHKHSDLCARELGDYFRWFLLRIGR